MPASRPKRVQALGRWPHTVKPDKDKALRSTLDGLTDGGRTRGGGQGGEGDVGGDGESAPSLPDVRLRRPITSEAHPEEPVVVMRACG